MSAAMQARIRQAAEMQRQGMSVLEIGQRLHVTRGTANWMLDQYRAEQKANGASYPAVTQEIQGRWDREVAEGVRCKTCMLLRPCFDHE